MSRQLLVPLHHHSIPVIYRVSSRLKSNVVRKLCVCVSPKKAAYLSKVLSSRWNVNECSGGAEHNSKKTYWRELPQLTNTSHYSIMCGWIPKGMSASQGTGMVRIRAVCLFTHLNGRLNLAQPRPNQTDSESIDIRWSNLANILFYH